MRFLFAKLVFFLIKWFEATGQDDNGSDSSESSQIKEETIEVSLRYGRDKKYFDNDEVVVNKVIFNCVQRKLTVTKVIMAISKKYIREEIDDITRTFLRVSEKEGYNQTFILEKRLEDREHDDYQFFRYKKPGKNEYKSRTLYKNFIVEIPINITDSTFNALSKSDKGLIKLNLLFKDIVYENTKPEELSQSSNKEIPKNANSNVSGGPLSESMEQEVAKISKPERNSDDIADKQSINVKTTNKEVSKAPAISENANPSFIDELKKRQEQIRNKASKPQQTKSNKSEPASINPVVSTKLDPKRDPQKDTVTKLTKSSDTKNSNDIFFDDIFKDLNDVVAEINQYQEKANNRYQNLGNMSSTKENLKTELDLEENKNMVKREGSFISTN